jgi:anti-sigma regulatory factor (Ser/Thr protein kinase)
VDTFSRSRSGAAYGHDGYFHEAALYESDDEFLALVLPFLREGIEAAEPTFVALHAGNTSLVQEALGSHDGIIYVVNGLYARPHATLATWRELLAEAVRDGVGQIRAVGDVLRPGSDDRWQEWARYEAAVNHVLDDFPLWGLCPYDLRVTPDHVVEDVLRTHPWLATVDGGHVSNPGFSDPLDFLAEHPAIYVDPVEVLPPTVELADPVPVQARHDTRVVCARSGMVDDESDAFTLAVSEALVNAMRHGTAPVRLRLWGGRRRVVATVTDHGAGPRDPLSGWMRLDDGGPGGRGLWMIHRLCDQVVLRHEQSTFTICLIAGSGTTIWPEAAA